MKTPEEIKKGLECCSRSDSCPQECPYYDVQSCGSVSKLDALAYIQQLEEERNAVVLDHLYESGFMAGFKAADKPVRHGRWIEYTHWIGAFGQIYSKCSECGTTYSGRKGSRGDGKGGKFCEECGAKMDLEVQDDG